MATPYLSIGIPTLSMNGANKAYDTLNKAFGTLKNTYDTYNQSVLDKQLKADADAQALAKNKMQNMSYAELSKIDPSQLINQDEARSIFGVSDPNVELKGADLLGSYGTNKAAQENSYKDQLRANILQGMVNSAPAGSKEYTDANLTPEAIQQYAGDLYNPDLAAKLNKGLGLDLTSLNTQADKKIYNKFKSANSDKATQMSLDNSKLQLERTKIAMNDAVKAKATAKYADSLAASIPVGSTPAQTFSIINSTPATTDKERITKNKLLNSAVSDATIEASLSIPSIASTYGASEIQAIKATESKFSGFTAPMQEKIKKSIKAKFYTEKSIFEKNNFNNLIDESKNVFGKVSAKDIETEDSQGLDYLTKFNSQYALSRYRELITKLHKNKSNPNSLQFNDANILNEIASPSSFYSLLGGNSGHTFDNITKSDIDSALKTFKYNIAAKLNQLNNTGTNNIGNNTSLSINNNLTY